VPELLMKILPSLRAAKLGLLLGVAGVSLTAPARAELTLYDKDGWSFGTDGRINAFYSYTYGQGRPLENAPAPGAGVEHPVDNDNTIEASRIRSGFVGTVLGFNLKKQVTPTLAIKGRLAIWWTIEQRRTIGAGTNQVDGREAYLKIEGPWGAVMGGRTLAIFSRGNIELNAMYAHGNGVGYPCDVANYGPACGHVGFGVQYPGFTPSIRYNTPDTLGGLRFEAGIFDPVTLNVHEYERTPYPRVEGELAYQYAKDEDPATAKAWVSGTWQRMVQSNDDPSTPISLKKADPYGVAYGIRGGAGFFRAGIAGFFGKGLGINYPIETTQYPADEQQDLRFFDGYYGQVMLTFAKTDISFGAGVNRVHETDYDKAPLPPAMRANIIKTQRGISAGVFHHWEAVVFGVEYFRADYTWVYKNTQGINFFNAGATFKW
jgi:hypothetical protein